MLKPRRFISTSFLAGIVGTIRNTILQWSLRLEEEGIVGEGLSFSDEEKSRAASSTTIHIHDFKGVLGTVQGQNVQVGDAATIQGK
jgi:hypothetical protein